jgi:ribonuclease-3
VDELPRALHDLPEPRAGEDGGPARPLTELEAALDHRFVRPALLRVALTLGSWAHEHPEGGWPSNACLEFFGDAVLDLVAADAVWRRFPDHDEGELTRLRASVVSERALAAVAEGAGLGEWLWLGRGDEKLGGRAHPRTLADAVEAVLGAVFLDARAAGADPFAAARRAFERLFGDLVDALRPEDALDPKSRLQQWAQASHRTTPTYVREPGEGEGARWRARVELRHADGRIEVLGEGEGESMKEAEQRAAVQALAKLDEP